MLKRLERPTSTKSQDFVETKTEVGIRMNDGKYVDFTQYPAGKHIRSRALMDDRYCSQIRVAMAAKFLSIVGDVDLSVDDELFDWCDHMEAHAIDYKKDIEINGNPKALTADTHKKKRDGDNDRWEVEVTGTSDAHGNSVARSSVPEIERLHRVAATRNAVERDARLAANRPRVPSDGNGCWYCQGAHYSSDCPDWWWYQSHPEQRGQWR